MYTPRIATHYEILIDIFTKASTSRTHVDASRLFLDLFFDVISDLTLGESFNTLATGQRHAVVVEFLAQQKTVGFVLLTMWIFHLIRCIPVITSRIAYWLQRYSSTVAQRGDVREKSSRRKRQWYANALEKRKQVRLQLLHGCD
jgi:hypothetical protein